MCGACAFRNAPPASSCVRCGMTRGARSYPAYCPSCGKTVHAPCGHEGLSLSIAVASALDSTAVCDRCDKPKYLHTDTVLFCPFISTFRARSAKT